MQGSDFDDTLLGADGSSEQFRGNAGDDFIDGGTGGFDEVNYAFDPAGVTVELSAGTATDGIGDSDTLVNIELVRGTDFADSITGDTLKGAGGNDTLEGGPGNDALEGDSGTDTFVYAAGDGGSSLALADVISDFEDGRDVIGLSGGLGFGDLTIGDDGGNATIRIM